MIKIFQFVITALITFNFVGDGLRDFADWSHEFSRIKIA